MFGIWAQGFIDGAGQLVLWLGFLTDDDDDWGRETNILSLCASFDILHDKNVKQVCFVRSNTKNIAHTLTKYTITKKRVVMLLPHTQFMMMVIDIVIKASSGGEMNTQTNGSMVAIHDAREKTKKQVLKIEQHRCIYIFSTFSGILIIYNIYIDVT